MEFLIVGIIGIIIALIINFFVAGEFANIAEMKGYHGNVYFWFTFLFGIAGMLMVVALPIVSEEEVANPIELQKEESKPSIIVSHAPVASDEWKCTCGRIHKNYETSCVCGTTRSE